MGNESDDKSNEANDAFVGPPDLRWKDRYGRPYRDGSDNFGLQRPTDTANGHILHFHSVPTGATVHFKAFLTEFSDTYESNWNDEFTFGRMDPISTFQRTKRNIKLSWEVPAASVQEAKFNLAEAERFVSMLYPVYQNIRVSEGLSEEQEEELKSIRKEIAETEQNAQQSSDDAVSKKNRAREGEILAAGQKEKKQAGVMIASPLIKFKFSNLIMDNRNGASIKAGAASAGLVGKLSGLTYQPDIESGFFGHNELDGVEEGALLPQTIKFSCDFTVLHTSPLGWNRRTKRSKRFPYHSDDVNRKK